MHTRLIGFSLVALLASCAVAADKDFQPLFSEDGPPKGWTVREWNDLTKKVSDAEWTVKDGVLHSGQRRGTWLRSDKEYTDVILEFEIKLTKVGNSGVALRAPTKGDPPFDGMELQVADYRYNTQPKDSELTGGIYRAIAPSKQVYKPTEWNKFRVELKGVHLKVTLNGEVTHDVDLDQYDQPVKRHYNSNHPTVQHRPRHYHIA